MLVFLDAEFVGFVGDDFLEAVIAEVFLEVGDGVEGGLGLEVAGEAGAGVEAGFVVVVEEVDVGSLDGHGGEEEEGADVPPRLLFVGDALPFGEGAGCFLGLGGAVVSEFGDPDRLTGHLLIAPVAEALNVGEVFLELGVFGEAAFPGGPADELGVGVDGEDVDEVVHAVEAGDALFVITAGSGGEVAGGDFEGGVGGAKSGGHGAEDAVVVGVAPLAGFVADLDGLDEFAVAGGAEFLGEVGAVGAGVFFEVVPVFERDGFEHEAGVGGPAFLSP